MPNVPPSETPFSLDETQQKAVERCCDMSRRIVGVTGPAGTGKTTILRNVYDELTAAGYRVGLGAPTGKAAKRITEATGIPAMTFHRMLEYPLPGERDPETGEEPPPGLPRRNASKPVEYQVILGDEYKMVSSDLHRNIIDALPRGGCIRVFGDMAQLPPVEDKHVDKRFRHSPFAQILKEFEGVRLTTIHRQDEGSGIVYNADRIRRGLLPTQADDFVIHKVSDVPAALRAFIVDQLNNGLSWAALQRQLIVPMKKNAQGTHALNVAMQRLFNPEAVAHGERMTRETWDSKYPVTIGPKDKMLWTKNTYDLRSVEVRYNEHGFYIQPTIMDQIFNGESGVVGDQLNGREGYTELDVGDRLLQIPHVIREKDQRNNTFPVDFRKRTDLAYAVTTHKAQGSEWDEVAVVISKSMSYMLNRRNLYTAVTRAKKRVHLFCDQFALNKSLAVVGDD